MTTGLGTRVMRNLVTYYAALLACAVSFVASFHMGLPHVAIPSIFGAVICWVLVRDEWHFLKNGGKDG